MIEHVDDPFAFLHEMEQRAELVEVNLLEPAPDDQDAHHELPIADLLRHVADRGLHLYEVLHGRSHLVIYSPAPGSTRDRAVNRVQLAISRWRRQR